MSLLLKATDARPIKNIKVSPRSDQKIVVVNCIFCHGFIASLEKCYPFYRMSSIFSRPGLACLRNSRASQLAFAESFLNLDLFYL